MLVKTLELQHAVLPAEEANAINALVIAVKAFNEVGERFWPVKAEFAEAERVKDTAFEAVKKFVPPGRLLVVDGRIVRLTGRGSLEPVEITVA